MKLWIFLAVLLVVLAVAVESRSLQKAKRSVKSSSSKTKTSSEDDLEATGRLALKRWQRAEKQRQQVLKLYNNIIYPTSSYIAAAIEQNNYTVVESYLLANVTGRINPLGRFDTFFSTGEYFYSLAGPLPGMPTAGRGRVTDLWWTGPIVCTNNSCYFRVDIGLRNFNDNVNARNFTHIGVMNFDSTDRICSYEVDFLGIERTLNLPENNAVRQSAYAQLCGAVGALCTGPNLQYNGAFTDCMAFLNSIPYGGWGSADQNTVACRQLHLALVPGNPAVHCPHVGQTGGGKCVFHSGASYYQDAIDTCRDKNW